jgi:hypothetical protein
MRTPGQDATGAMGKLAIELAGAGSSGEEKIHTMHASTHFAGVRSLTVWGSYPAKMRLGASTAHGTERVQPEGRAAAAAGADGFV